MDFESNKSRLAKELAETLRNRPEEVSEWNILMVSADSSQKLKLQAEEREIRKAIRLASHRDVTINIDVLPAATIDDLGEKLLWKSAQGSSYNLLHFSGHCDEVHHMQKLICEELGRQHGMDVLHRFQGTKAGASRIHALAVQVSKYLEQQAGTYMDELLHMAEMKQNHEEKTADDEDHENEDVENDMNCRNRSRSMEGSKPFASADNEARAKSLSPKKGKNMESLIPYRSQYKQSDEEQRVEDRPLWVFSENEPTNEKQNKNHFLNENDAIVLQLPDANCRTTKDIILTKRQILDAGVGSLAFEKHDGQGMNFVGSRAFASLISPYALDLRCVLLNACNSQLVCEQILSTGIPMAICSRGRMADRDALAFSRGFYEALAHGNSVERAFLEGKNRIAANLRYHQVRRPMLASTRNQPHPEEENGGVILLRSNGTMRLNPVRVREHHLIDAENKGLKMVIQDGLKLLSEKDREIEKLKEEIAKLQQTNKLQAKKLHRARVGLLPKMSKATTATAKQASSEPKIKVTATKRANTRKSTPLGSVNGPSTTDSAIENESPNSKEQTTWKPAGQKLKLRKSKLTSFEQPHETTPSVSAGGPQNNQHSDGAANHILPKSGFGSSVPRFPTITVPNPARYDNCPSSPK